MLALTSRQSARLIAPAGVLMNMHVANCIGSYQSPELSSLFLCEIWHLISSIFVELPIYKASISFLLWTGPQKRKPPFGSQIRTTKGSVTFFVKEQPSVSTFFFCVSLWNLAASMGETSCFTWSKWNVGAKSKMTNMMQSVKHINTGFCWNLISFFYYYYYS